MSYRIASQIRKNNFETHYLTLDGLALLRVLSTRSGRSGISALFGLEACPTGTLSSLTDFPLSTLITGLVWLVAALSVTVL